MQPLGLLARWALGTTTDDEDVHRRAVLLLGFAAAAGATGPVFILLNLMVYRLPGVAAVTAVATLGAAITPWVLRGTGSIQTATAVFGASVAGAVITISGSFEGLTSPALAWLALIPVLGTMVGGRTAGLVGTGTVLVGLAGLVVADALGMLPNRELPAPMRRVAAAWNHGLLVVVMGVCAYTAEQLRKQAMARAHAAQERLNQVRVQAVASERMAALGTLAAGVAHEVSNPVTFISGNLAMVLESHRQVLAGAPASMDLEDSCAALEDALAGAQRVRSIVQDLNAFAGHNTATAGAVDLVTLLEQAGRLVANGFRNRVDLTLDLAPCPKVRATHAQLSPLVLSLLTNAAAAFTNQETPGRVHIYARPVGPHAVELGVEDHGAGMTQDALARVLEPFFTARPGEEGVGLGLGVCMWMAERLGGTMTVDSRPGAGTHVRVLLPAA